MFVKNLIFLVCLFHIQFYSSVFGNRFIPNGKVETSSAKLYIPIRPKSKVGYTGYNTVIPCRPSSPEYNVTLYAEIDYNQFERIDGNSRISFDPNVGFTIQHINSHDDRRYKCEFQRHTNENPQSFIYDLKNVVDAPRITIVNSPLQYTVEGDDYNLECKIHPVHELLTNYQVQWRVPNGDVYIESTSSPDSRISTNMKTLNYYDEGIVQYLILIRSLEIKNISRNDAGTYKCEFKSLDLQLAANTTLNVQDMQLISVHMNLFNSENSENAYQRPGLDAKLSATIKTTSNHLKGIEVEWIRGDSNKLLVANEKYEITTTSNSTQLVIKKVKAMQDTGMYTVRVINGRRVQTASTLLQIWDRSVELNTTFKPSYKPSTEIQIRCKVSRPPQKTVTWYFKKYLGSNRYEEPGELLENFSVKNESIKFVVSTTFLKLTTTGRIRCQACFSDTCGHQEHDIVVADDRLEIAGFDGAVIEESNFITTCSASLYYYYDNITWQDENGQIINETDRIQTSVEKDGYNISKSTIEIKSVTTSDSSTYKCVATAINGTLVSTKKILSVKEIIVSIDTNMNNSKSYFDEQTARTTIIVFTCYVSGLPRPNISWTKDGVAIVQNHSRYEFFNESQELHIIHPTIQQSGLYICKAQINRKSKEVSQTVEIEGDHLIMKIVLGTTIPILACIIFGLYYFTIQREKTVDLELTPRGLANFEEGDLENLDSLMNTDDQVLCLPYNKKWEFPRENLKFQKRLGSGQFGVVVKAKARGISETYTVIDVAVKMLKKTKSLMYLKVLASELKILCYIGRHINIVNLLGASTSNISRGELLVIVEYCRYGSILSFLRKYRDNFVSDFDPSALNSPFSPGRASESAAGNNNENSTNAVPQKRHRHHSVIITAEDLLVWAFQVARGMDYLGQRRVFHGDLAARNVLLTDNNIVKICDFGLARNLYHYDFYEKTTNAPLPLKWMAVESIRDRIFSPKSDVWAYGILLWEMFSLGITPYPEFASVEVYDKLIAGYRMRKTEYMSDAIYSVMRQCWNIKPALRPSFAALERTIGTMLPRNIVTHFVDLNSPYVQFNEAESHGARDYLSLVSRPDLRLLMSRSNNENVTISESIAADDQPASSSNQSPNPTQSPNTARHVDFENLPSTSRAVNIIPRPDASASLPSPSQPVSNSPDHSRTSRGVRILRSMLIGRIVGFKNPYYIPADNLPRP